MILQEANACAERDLDSLPDVSDISRGGSFAWNGAIWYEPWDAQPEPCEDLVDQDCENFWHNLDSDLAEPGMKASFERTCFDLFEYTPNQEGLIEAILDAIDCVENQAVPDIEAAIRGIEAGLRVLDTKETDEGQARRDPRPLSDMHTLVSSKQCLPCEGTMAFLFDHTSESSIRARASNCSAHQRLRDLRERVMARLNGPWPL